MLCEKRDGSYKLKYKLMEKDGVVSIIDYPDFKLGAGPFFYGLFYLFRWHKTNTFKLIRHIFTDYFAKQLKRTSAIYIDTPIDEEILPRPEAMGTYFGFIPFLVGSLGFLKKEFQKRADKDVDNLIISLVDFYSDIGFIFYNAPTTFANRKTKGLGMTLLHFFDRPRNYFPSLHVILVSYAYYKVCQIIDKYSDDPRGSEMIKEHLFQRVAGIVESCILTKQHSIRDIAGGLALVSNKEKEFGVEVASRIIHAMFLENSFGMADNVIGRVKLEIERISFDIMSYMKRGNDGNYNQSFVDYIKNIKGIKKA